MTSRKKLLENFKLYAVTDLKKVDRFTLKRIEAILRGGADIIQLRSKTLSDLELYQVGKGIKKLVRKYRKLFFVNDRLDLCRALDADGIHIGQDDLPVKIVRSMLRRGRLIGKSTHSLTQAKKTLREDVDYIGCGPIYGTPTKPHYRAVGLSLIPKVKAIAKKPVVCIGGINLKNIDQVLDAGANRVAVVRALFEARNPYQVAREFKRILEK